MKFFILVAIVISATWTFAQTPAEMIARGDSCWNALNSGAAFQFYNAAAEHNGDDRQIAWRQARNYTAFALTAISQQDEIWNYNHAKEYADRAVAYDSNNEDAHISLAVFYGWRTFMERGNEEKLRASRTMHDEILRSLALDANDDFAWNLLGQWNREVAKLSWVKKIIVKLIYGGLPDASFDEAVKDLQHAIALRPQRIMHYLELGKTYLAMGEKKLSRDALQHAIDLPHNDGVDEKEKDEARKLLHDGE